MRIPYTYTERDEILGVLINELDCELVCSVDEDADGKPIVFVEGVYVDGMNLYRGTALTRALAARIAGAVEDDESIAERVFEAEGIVFRGRGPNDPASHFERAW